MRTNKGTYLLLILMLACTTCMAQMMTSFSFSAIGSLNGSVVSTSPIVLSGSGNCLSFSTGVSSLTIGANGTGAFGSGCKEVVPVADTMAFAVSLRSLSVYPNPTHGVTVLKADGNFDKGLSGLVTVVGIDGKIVMSQMVPMSAIKTGYVINTAAFAAGNYTVVVELMQKRYSLRLIKL